MKVAAAQLNPLIGDFSQNFRKIALQISRARVSGADLIVFPELAIVGYPPRDLLDYEPFVEQNLRALESLIPLADGICVICGFVARNPGKTGKPFFNAAAVLADKQIAHTYHKKLLPYYDVFEEERYFESGEASGVFSLGKHRIGIAICEDTWGLSETIRRPYVKDPLEDLKSQGLDLLVNLSASPFHLGRPHYRLSLFKKVAQLLQAPVLFCNQVGGNDELLFDGSSFLTNPKGEILCAAKNFEEDLLVGDTGQKPLGRDPWSYSEAQWLFRALVMGVRDYLEKCGGRRVCLGLSGGIDSSVVAAIAAEAVGPENVLGVGLPSRFNLRASAEDAAALAKALGISYRSIPIEAIFKTLQDSLQKEAPAALKPLTLENLQPRVRMTLLMAIANEEGRMLLNTSNKSEIATGYATLYGDSSGALSVLGDLTKGQVYALAELINARAAVIPKRVIKRPPSAELRENQTDQDTLPPYSVLDQLVVEGVQNSRAAEELEQGFEKRWVDLYRRLHSASEYKRRQLPPVLRVSSRAFGMGRRVPVASRKPW